MTTKRTAEAPSPARGRSRPSGGDAAGTGVRRGKRWAYGELGVDDIIRAAGAVIQRDGADALSMRRVADELGLSTMGMYYYVQNKQELLTLVVEQALRRVVIPPDESGPWDERLRQLMRSARVELGRYPGLVKLMVDQHLATPRSTELSDAARQLLVEGGFADDPVALLHTTSVFINHLFGTLTWSIGPWVRPSTEDEPVPHGSGLAQHFDEELFEYGMNLVIEGLRARLAAGERGLSPTRPVSTAPRAEPAAG